MESKVQHTAHQKTKARQTANPKRVLKDHYTSAAYADVIKKAIKKANRSLPKDQQIPHWTPYQLRHAGVTKLVFENNGGCNIARAVAGQKSIDITQGYNHADLEIAIEQAKKRGK